MPSSPQTILVTGGAGYIGSHTVLALQQKGYRVIVLDNLVYGHRELVKDVLGVEIIEGDINDYDLLCKNLPRSPNHSRHSLRSLRLRRRILHIARQILPQQRRRYAHFARSHERLRRPVILCSLLPVLLTVRPKKFPSQNLKINRPINPYGATKLTCRKDSKRL